MNAARATSLVLVLEYRQGRVDSAESSSRLGGLGARPGSGHGGSGLRARSRSRSRSRPGCMEHRTWNAHGTAVSAIAIRLQCACVCLVLVFIPIWRLNASATYKRIGQEVQCCLSESLLEYSTLFLPFPLSLHTTAFFYIFTWGGTSCSFHLRQPRVCRRRRRQRPACISWLPAWQCGET